jgi:hypothetical protein
MPPIRPSKAGDGPRRPDRIAGTRKHAAAEPEPPTDTVVIRDAVGRPIRTLPARRTT